jgi:hypothetical protein
MSNQCLMWFTQRLNGANDEIILQMGLVFTKKITFVENKEISRISDAKFQE